MDNFKVNQYNQYYRRAEPHCNMDQDEKEILKKNCKVRRCALQQGSWRDSYYRASQMRLITFPLASTGNYTELWKKIGKFLPAMFISISILNEAKNLICIEIIL